MIDKIEGRNPVYEAIKSGRTIDKIFIKQGENEGSIRRIIGIAKELRIPIVEVNRQKLDEMSETHSHQGVIAMAPVKEYATVEDIFALAKSRDEKPFIVICDKINDPHNLGSIIRTANVAGAHGVIIPKHDSVGLSGVVAKTSAGAVEFTPVARVTNLVKTIESLKKEGVWVIGADGEADTSIYSQDFSGAVAIVVGSEGEGISPLVAKKCDFLVRIPMKGDISSLNASVAAGIMIFETMRCRHGKL